MATASVRIKKINEHLTCTICVEIYREPKILPCQHTFCCKCLLLYVEKQLIKSNFRCPLCREITVTPEGGVSNLPTNFLIQNIADEVDDASDGQVPNTPAVCESCDVNERPGIVAVAFCETCSEHLCTQCVDAHARLKLTRDHKVNQIQQEVKPKPKPKPKPRKKKDSVDLGAGEDETAVKAKESWHCKAHIGQDIQCFCLTCSTPMCGSCLTELIGKSKHKHTNHKIESLQNALDSVQTEIDTQITKVDELCSEVTQGVAHVSELDAGLETSYRSLVTDIQDAADHMKTIVDRWAENMSKKAESLFHEKQDELTSEKRSIQASAEKLRAGEQSARDKTKNAGLQILMKRGEVMKKLTELHKAHSNLNLPQPIRLALTEVMDDTTSVRLHSLMGDVRIDGLSAARADSMASLISDVSLDSEAAKEMVATKVVCSYRPVKGSMTGMCITRFGHFLGINSEAKTILHYNMNDKYRFSLVATYGDRLLNPLDVDQLPDGRVVVSDGKEGHCIRVFTPMKVNPYFHMSGCIAHRLLEKATGIATTPDNRIIITDVDKQVVYGIELQGGDNFRVYMEIHRIKDKPQFQSPQFIACSQTSGDFVVSDRNQSCVKIFDRNGKFKTKHGSWGVKSCNMRKPGGVCYDAQGRIYIADVLNNRIHILGPDGKFQCFISVKKACGKFQPPPDMLAITPLGDLMLANSDGCIKILKLTFN